MKIFCWDRFDDGSYGGDASAAVIAETLSEARDLLRCEWERYLATHPPDERTRYDGSRYTDASLDRDDAPSFYGVSSPRLYARGFATGIAIFEPSRVIPLPDDVPSQIVLLHKGYEG